MANSTKSCSIPVRGDRNYVNAVSAVARTKRITMAELVRQAIDAAYGSEVAQAAIFFADSGVTNHHTEQKITNTKRGKR